MSHNIVVYHDILSIDIACKEPCATIIESISIDIEWSAQRPIVAAASIFLFKRKGLFNPMLSISPVVAASGKKTEHGALMHLAEALPALYKKHLISE